MAEFEIKEEASQTRVSCGAKGAPHRAARSGPVRPLALSQGRLFTAQKRLAQDDNSRLRRGQHLNAFRITKLYTVHGNLYGICRSVQRS
jgi:hypothetical protein